MCISTPRSNLVVRFLSAFLLCCTSLYASVDQTGKQKITVVGNDVTLENVFRQIEKQTGLRFMYAVDAVDVKERVSVVFERVMLDDVLEDLLGKKGIEWVYRGGAISLKKTIVVSDSSKNSDLELLSVAGRILDVKGNPIPGATVALKGAKKGTKTDGDGRFALQGIEMNSILLISSIGFQTKEVVVQEKNLVVHMNEAIGSLDETVIVGYGTTTQRFNTGNVTSIKAEDIAKQPVSDPLLAIQGRVPGMIITQTTGVQGGKINILIRGKNSLNSGTQPLFIIDGIPYTPNLTTSPGSFLGGGRGAVLSALSFINPLDIESIDVLKDADATAIYGSRGANGVVLITTKKGKIGTSKVDVNFYSGWGAVARYRELMNTSQYLEMRREAFKNDNLIPSSDMSDPGYAPDLTIWDTTRYTDWQKELLGKNSRLTDVQATISGGGGVVQYTLGGNYHKETTVFPGDFSNQNGGVHLSITGNSPDQRLRTSITTNFFTQKNDLPAADFGSYIDLAPNAPPGYNEDGSLNWANSTWDNPYQQLISNIVDLQTANLLNNININYRLLPGFVLQSSLGYNDMRTNTFNASTIAGVPPQSRNNATARAIYADMRTKSWIWEPQINYTTELWKGTLNVLVGTTLLGNKLDAKTMAVNGIQSDALIKNVAAGATYKGNGRVSNYKYSAIFGRIGYNLQEKYLLNLTWRRDGSSRFGAGRQFASFWAVGAGWIFSQESLFKNEFPILSYGKIRASYGTTGNDQIGDYAYLDQYLFQQQLYQGVRGIQVVGLYNSDFAWELTSKAEVGLETGFLKDRLLFNISYYRNRSSNQIVSYNLPGMVGATSIRKNLPAVIGNTGLEFALTTENIKGNNFSWSTSFNLSINRNKLISYSGNRDIFARVGESLTQTFLSKFIGVNSADGTFLFENFDGKPGPAAEANILAVSLDLTPEFFGGFQNSFRFKGVQLDIFCQYVKQKGRDGLYSSYAPGMLRNQSIHLLNRWQKEGDIKPFQRVNANSELSGDFDSFYNSDGAYGDASFIRCKNVALSWQLPQKWKTKMHLGNCRIYLQCQNLFTITNYKGWDPETQSPITLPPLRVITIGGQIGL